MTKLQMVLAASALMVVSVALGTYAGVRYESHKNAQAAEEAAQQRARYVMYAEAYHQAALAFVDKIRHSSGGLWTPEIADFSPAAVHEGAGGLYEVQLTYRE